MGLQISALQGASWAFMFGLAAFLELWRKYMHKQHGFVFSVRSATKSTGTGTATCSIGKGKDVDVDVDCGCNDLDVSVLPCIRNRRSVFPRAYDRNPPPLSSFIVQSLLDAALWGPFHGSCYKGNHHPARFVVLGKEAMVEMQKLTLDFYDRYWNKVGCGCDSSQWNSDADAGAGQYETWRKQTEDEITGRWAPCSYMIAIIMRRQTGPKLLPEWEEAAAVAAAVQNMHIQSTKFPQLACYWSSWHDAARDSNDMKDFLGMDAEDKCMGFFMVAQIKRHSSFRQDRRRRDRSLMAVEWRH